MALTSASYTLADLNDAPSYQLQLSMSGLPSGTLSIAFYRDGSLFAGTVYLQVRSWDGAAWSESQATGSMSGGTKTYGYTSGKAFDVQVYTDATKATLLATSFVSYGETGSQGESGSDARDFSIVASSPTFRLSSRGVTLASQSITLGCSLLNIDPAGVEVGWSTAEPASLGSSTGQSTLLTIPANAAATTVQVTCTVTGYGSKTLVINGIKGGDEVPVYLGVLPVTDPAIEDHFVKAEGRFISGDFYLYSIATGNYPKWYNGTGWIAVDENTPYYSAICAATLADALRQPGTVLSTSAIYGFIEHLSANDAFIAKLGAQVITLLTGGKIQSENYVEGVSGFLFKADGTLNAVSANLINAVISGSGVFKGILDSIPIKTTAASEAGSAISFPSKTHWLSDEMYDDVSLSESTTLQAISGSYNSKTVSYATRLVAGARAVLSTASGSGTSNGSHYEDTNTTPTVEIINTTMPTGTEVCSYSIYLDAYVNTTFSLPHCWITKNGVTVADSGNVYYSRTWAGSFAASAGDVIIVYVKGGYERDEGQSYSSNLTGNGSVSGNSVIGKGLFLKYSDSTVELIGMGLYSKGLSLTGYTPTYNYAKATDLISEVQSYTVNEMKAAEGTITLDGTEYTVIGVMKVSATQIAIFHANGSFSFVSPDADPGTTGYYNASGSYAVIASVAGAETMHVNAKTVDTYSIGLITRFLNIVGKNLIGENLTLTNYPTIDGREAYACRAWVNFNGATNTGGYCTIRASANVSSVADNALGIYTINFETAMPDANYAVAGAAMEDNGLVSGSSFQSAVSLGGSNTFLAGSLQIQNANIDTNANVDGTYITVSIFR